MNGTGTTLPSFKVAYLAIKLVFESPLLSTNGIVNACNLLLESYTGLNDLNSSSLVLTLGLTSPGLFLINSNSNLLKVYKSSNGVNVESS